MGTQPPPEESSTPAESADSTERVANGQQSSERAARGVVVAMVCPYDLSVVGGVQSHVFDVVAEMMKRGKSVAVLAPVGDPAAIATRVGAWPQWLTNAGPARSIAINGSQAPVRLGLGQRRQIRQWLRQVRPDVLHVHEPFVPALSMPAVFAARSVPRRDGGRLPVVGTFHASVDSLTLLRVAAPLLRATARRLDRCIAVSEMAARTVTHISARTEPKIIANPVDTARFARAALPKPQPAREAGQVLFLGRGDEPRKGLADMLAAWPLVRAARPHARLAVAGRVSERDVAHVSGVDVIGAVPEPDKPGIYAGADVYVAPHRGGESMGLVLVEAMASATAVVATDLPAFRAVSGDGAAAALVPPRDPVALAEAIVRVLDDESYRTALIATGQQRARDFDIASVLDQIEAVYRSV